MRIFPLLLKSLVLSSSISVASPVRDHAQSQQSITAIEKNNLQKESDRAIADMRGRMECKIEEIPEYTERQTARAIKIIESGIT